MGAASPMHCSVSDGLSRVHCIETSHRGPISCMQRYCRQGLWCNGVPSSDRPFQGALRLRRTALQYEGRTFSGIALNGTVYVQVLYTCSVYCNPNPDPDGAFQGALPLRILP